MKGFGDKYLRFIYTISIKKQVDHMSMWGSQLTHFRTRALHFRPMHTQGFGETLLTVQLDRLMVWYIYVTYVYTTVFFSPFVFIACLHGSYLFNLFICIFCLAKDTASCLSEHWFWHWYLALCCQLWFSHDDTLKFSPSLSLYSLGILTYFCTRLLKKLL